MKSSPSALSMGWNDPDWNWGSSEGKAHDVAMKTRNKLDTPQKREKWLENCSEDLVDVEEMKMVCIFQNNVYNPA